MQIINLDGVWKEMPTVWKSFDRFAEASTAKFGEFKLGRPDLVDMIYNLLES